MTPSVKAAVAVALVVVSAAATRAEAGAPRSATLPRTSDGRPNLAGIWKARNGGRAVGHQIPYQAWAAAKQRENFRARQTADPLSKCYLPGVPRIMSLDHPFQIFQTPHLVAMTFEWSSIYRVVYTDGSAHPEGLDFWMGDSRGRWEGDSLVVDVRNHNDRTWLDGVGNFHSEALTLVERYTPIDADTLAYEVTVEDPKVFTKPWSIRMRLARQKGIDRIGDRECLADAEEATGAFEREPATWYPGDGKTAVPVTTDVLRAAAEPKGPLPRPAPGAGPVRRLADGTADIQGFYSSMATGASFANFGLEPRQGTARRAALASPGFIIDPPDRLLPFQPWARALRQDRLRPERGYDDPNVHCLPSGSPRADYLNEQRILQPPGYVVVLFERMGFRIIALDGRAHPPDRVRLWRGDSVGHWDGDTLVVDTTNFTGKTWLNEPYGEHGGEVVTYAEHLIERITPVDGATIHHEDTVIDPVAYTRPWTISFTLKRSSSELLEVACKEDDQDLPHLKALKDAAR